MMKQDDDHNGKDKPRPFSFSFRIKMLILMVLLPVVVLSRFFIETPRQSIFPFSEQSKTDAQLLLYEKIKDSQLKTTAGNAKNDEWTPCWKLCPSRRNKIVYSFPGKAGLNDRFYIFYRLINMAGYLCATVIVPKPRDLLAEWHNDGKQVAPLSEWNDFRLTQWRMNTNMNGTYSFETSPILTAHSLTNIRSYLSEERKTASLFLTMSEKDQGWDQFHRLENYTLKQPKSGNDYFVWNLNSFFYESDLFWIPENTTMSLSVLGNPFPRSFPSGVPWWQWTGCEYYESTTPKHIQTIANNIWKEVKSVVDDATIGSFHIRRGDMKHEW